MPHRRRLLFALAAFLLPILLACAGGNQADDKPQKIAVVDPAWLWKNHDAVEGKRIQVRGAADVKTMGQIAVITFKQDGIELLTAAVARDDWGGLKDGDVLKVLTLEGVVGEKTPGGKIPLQGAKVVNVEEPPRFK